MKTSVALSGFALLVAFACARSGAGEQLLTHANSVATAVFAGNGPGGRCAPRPNPAVEWTVVAFRGDTCLSCQGVGYTLRRRAEVTADLGRGLMVVYPIEDSAAVCDYLTRERVARSATTIGVTELPAVLHADSVGAFLMFHFTRDSAAASPMMTRRVADLLRPP